MPSPNIQKILDLAQAYEDAATEAGAADVHGMQAADDLVHAQVLLTQAKDDEASAVVDLDKARQELVDFVRSVFPDPPSGN